MVGRAAMVRNKWKAVPLQTQKRFLNRVLAHTPVQRLWHLVDVSGGVRR